MGVDQGLALLTLSWDKNWDSHSLVNGYPCFYPRIALVAPSPGWHLCGGKSAILWIHGAGYSFLQTVQARRIILINPRALMIQKWRLTLLNTHSVPTWAPSWYSWHIISLSLWCLGRITGCLVPSGTEACLRRPPITSRPLSNTGQSLAKRLDFETQPFCFISSISFAKFVVWARLNMSVSDFAISDTEIRSLFTCLHFRYCTNRRNQQSAFYAL